MLEYSLFYVIYSYNLVLNLIIKNSDFKREISILKEYIKKIYILRESLADR